MANLNRSTELDKSLSAPDAVEEVQDGFTRSRRFIKGKNKSAKSSRNRGSGRLAPAPVSKGNASGKY